MLDKSGLLDDAAPSINTPHSYADQIAGILEREIIGGRYARHERLQQEEVCRRFGVSRTPAREALRKLQALGLVDLIPNRGAVVNKPTLEELQQTYEVRAELEGFAAALAARHLSEDFLVPVQFTHERLTEAVGRAEARLPGPSTATSSVDDAALLELNNEFHRLVHFGSENLRLTDTIHGLERYFPKDVIFKTLRNSGDLHRFYVADHEEILRHVVAGREAEAREAMSAHIRNSQVRLLGYLREIGYD